MNIKQFAPFAIFAAILSVSPGTVLIAATDAQKAATKEIHGVRAPELAAKASQIVSSAKASERKDVSIALVRSVASKQPTALTIVVASIAAAAPDLAPVVAAAAAKAIPKQAELIAMAAAQAAPDQADKIAAEVALAVPASAATIANSVARVLPQSTARIMAAVGLAVPEAPLNIRLLSTSRSASHAPGHPLIRTRPGPVTTDPIIRAIITNNPPVLKTNVIVQFDPARYGSP